MARFIYRDYRPGHHGEFTTEETWKRSRAQGSGLIKRERIEDASDEDTSFDPFDFDPADYSDDDLVEVEFGGAIDY